MKRIGNLYKRVIAFENLYTAFKKAFKGAHRSRESLRFYFRMEWELKRLQEELGAQTYQPGRYRYFKIYAPKDRRIAVAPFRDRVVHHAIVNVLEPIYERCFIYDSYATRKGKGTHHAILRAQQFLRRNRWFLKADIHKYFDSVHHDVLMAILERKIIDRELLWLMEKIIRHGNRNGRGIPIGNLTSQFLANVYLDPFDHFVKEQLKVRHYLRYMDDFVLFANEKEWLKDNKALISQYLEERLHLKLKEKAVIVNQRRHGLSFLGGRIFPGLIRIRRENLQRSLRRYRLRLYQHRAGKLDDGRLQQSLASISGYLSFFNTYRLRQHIFGAGVVQAPTA